MFDSCDLEELLSAEPEEVREELFNKISLDTLREADKLCARCCELSDSEMLCSGIRSRLNRQKWDSLKQAYLYPSACHKRNQKDAVGMLNARLETSGIPASFYTECPHYEALSVDLSSGIILAGERKPSFLQAEFSLSNTKYMWGVAVHAVRANYTVRYIVPSVLLASGYVSDEELSGITEGYDLLILDRVNSVDGKPTQKEKLFNAILDRIAARKPVIATLTSNAAQTHTGSEDLLVKEVASWSSLRND